jgi:hypothetical protein
MRTLIRKENVYLKIIYTETVIIKVQSINLYVSYLEGNTHVRIRDI